jgi:hypothetical protein
VRPEFRIYAGQLTSGIFRQKNVTFVDATPDPDTFPVIAAMGCKRYCKGRFVAALALSAPARGVRVRTVAPDISAGADLSEFECQLLLDHRDYACIGVICEADRGRHPFVFQPRHKAGLVRFAVLVYCRHVKELVRFAGSLGRFLLLRGFALVIADADGPISGLVGRYSDGIPKYFRGPLQPRHGDLAYSERVLFGF